MTSDLGNIDGQPIELAGTQFRVAFNGAYVVAPSVSALRAKFAKAKADRFEPFDALAFHHRSYHDDSASLVRVRVLGRVASKRMSSSWNVCLEGKTFSVGAVYPLSAENDLLAMREQDRADTATIDEARERSSARSNVRRSLAISAA